MAIKLNRINGQNYADNIIDYLLFFDEGTWTIASGTGTSLLDTNNPYVGLSSLRVENNVPASTITATNSTQNTAITGDGGLYQLSWYAKKDIAEEVRSGSVLIYKNAVLLDTQTFSLGDESASADKNDQWFRFQSDNTYNLAKNDIITFQFRVNEATTAELTTFIYFDGVMLNRAERLNTIVPYYTKPTSLPVVLENGWQSRFQADTQVLTGATSNLITIIGSDESNGGLSLLDVNGKVTPVKQGDYIGVDFACTVVTPSGTDNYITVDFISNSNVYRSYTKSLLKGDGNDDTFSIGYNFPVGSDLFTNGLEVYITPNTGLSIKDKYISVGRLIIGK